LLTDLYELRTWLWVPRPRYEVFAFFGDAANLERITPPFLRFRVLTPPPIAMRPGTLIDYRLSLHRVPLRWRTEIEAWEPPHRFVDRQLHGPYRQWVHTHTFSDKDGGTQVEDQVLYRLRGPSPFTRMVHGLLVGPDTRQIFEFRHQALGVAFGGHSQVRPGPVTITRRTA
jgi:ligand-binding SRPBCC domain-containing protein